VNRSDGLTEEILVVEEEEEDDQESVNFQQKRMEALQKGQMFANPNETYKFPKNTSILNGTDVPIREEMRIDDYSYQSERTEEVVIVEEEEEEDTSRHIP